MNKIIHKRTERYYVIAMDVVCGRWAQYTETSYLWKNVTCKNCLKHLILKWNKRKGKYDKLLR